MLFNFLGKPKYSVWPETGGCTFLRVAVFVGVHQFKPLFFTGFHAFFKKGHGKSIQGENESC